MSPVKEPAFFTELARNRIQEKSEYLHLFHGVTDEIAIGEATPQYLADPKSARRIHEVIPDARIIMILRDPVERAFSHWFMKTNYWNRETIPFAESVKNSAIEKDRRKMEDHIWYGFYSDKVQRYLEIFGSDYVKILIFEEFIHDIQGSVDDIFEFLRVAKIGSELVSNAEPHNPSNQDVPRNKLARNLFSISKFTRSIVPSTFRRYVKRKMSKRMEKPTIEARDRGLLENLYRDDAKKLAVILKRPLPWSWAQTQS